MALHRDIFWVGRQWAVTGHGVQACDQRQKSQYDVAAGQLWDQAVLAALRQHAWLNVEDFETALSLARQRFPEPEQPPAPPTEPVVDVVPSRIETPDIEPPPEAIATAQPIPAAAIEPPAAADIPKSDATPPPRPKARFTMCYGGSAKFARPWRVQKR